MIQLRLCGAVVELSLGAGRWVPLWKLLTYSRQGPRQGLQRALRSCLLRVHAWFPQYCKWEHFQLVCLQSFNRDSVQQCCSGGQCFAPW